MQTIKLARGGEVTIRCVHSTDAKGYLFLLQSIAREKIFSIEEEVECKTVGQTREWIDEELKNPSNLVLVASFNGQIVGQLDFAVGKKKRISHTGQFGLNVEKNFRGKGIGKALLESFLTWAKDTEDLEKIIIFVHQTNCRAIALYKKFGFQEEGTITKHIKYSPTSYVSSVIMGLMLSPKANSY